MIIWNNQILDSGPLTSPQLFSGKGLFETILYENGIMWFAERHIRRLFHSARQLHFEEMPKHLDLQTVVSILKKHLIHKARIKCIMFSGKMEQSLGPNYFFQIIPIQRKNAWKDDISLITKRHPIYLHTFRKHKTINYGPYLFEHEQAQKAGFDEPLFLDENGKILETSIANIFAVKNQKIYTPPVSLGILPGIIREILLEEFPVEIKPISVNEINNFDYFFVTNSIRELRKVSQINKHVFRNFDDHFHSIKMKFEQIKEKYKKGEVT